MSHYDQLGVAPGAAPEQIRAAYRALVQLFHPDRLRHLKPEVREFAEERLKTLNQAYEVLGDPARRAEYDRRTLTAQPPPPAPAWRNAPDDYAPRAARDYTTAWPAADTTQDEAAVRRAAALERNQRKASLERQIAELDRNLHLLKVERDRMFAHLRSDLARARQHYWMTTALTGLGFWSVMLAGLALFTLPVRVSSGAAQVGVFLLLAVMYELASTFIIARALSGHLLRDSLTPLALAAGKSLLVSGVLGLVGWAGWRLAFTDVFSPAALAVLAGLFLAAHVIFCWLALGGYLRMMSEQRRLYDHNVNLVMQTYRDELNLARAQRAALDRETA